MIYWYQQIFIDINNWIIDIINSFIQIIVYIDINRLFNKWIIDINMSWSN